LFGFWLLLRWLPVPEVSIAPDWRPVLIVISLGRRTLACADSLARWLLRASFVCSGAWIDVLAYRVAGTRFLFSALRLQDPLLLSLVRQCRCSVYYTFCARGILPLMVFFSILLPCLEAYDIFFA